MSFKIHSFGYRSPNVPTFFDFAKMTEDSIVFDVRLNPVSPMNPFWSKSNLQQHLHDYRHIPQLGNTNYRNKGKPPRIVALDKGTDLLLNLIRQNYKCILMCACPEYNACHRKQIIDQLRKKEDVEHEVFFA